MIIDFFISRYVKHLLKQYNTSLKSHCFDLRELDQKIETLSSMLYKLYRPKFATYQDSKQDHLGFLATELYDSGGHTECLKILTKSLDGFCHSTLFLSKKNHSFHNAPTKISVIQNYCNVLGISSNRKKFTQNLIELYNQIIVLSPKVLMIYIHMDDVLSTAVLALLKKHTNIKIIFFNHASHFPALGFSFCDLVLEGMMTTHYVTKTFRHCNKSHVVGLQSLSKAETIYFSHDDIQKQRLEWGVTPDNLVTMTGCNANKLFDGNESEYFEMIRSLLLKEPKLKHIIISHLSEQQKQIVDRIFIRNESLLQSIVFIEPRADYDILFQSCDVFIDSFPVSSALTQIDLMRNKKSTVVKINRKNALFSFHEYMPNNYPYMFENVSEMESGILKLLYDKDEQHIVTDRLYQYYLDNYEESIMRDKTIKFIEASDNLEIFFDVLPTSVSYQFKNIR